MLRHSRSTSATTRYGKRVHLDGHPAERRTDGAGAGTAGRAAGADGPKTSSASSRSNATLTFNERGGLGRIRRARPRRANLVLPRVQPTATAAAPAPAVAPSRRRPRSGAQPVHATGRRFAAKVAAGNGDGQRAVTEWDVATGKNIKWKTPIPGIANSSPIVWGNRIFVTIGDRQGGDNTFRTGLYGDVKPVDDLSIHEWKIYSLDKVSGRVIWERTASIGAPKTKRHTKSSQASSTPVTDGRRVVAVFGSAGPAHRLGLRRQGTVARRSRRPRQRMVLRSRLPVGALQLADHLSQLGDRSGGHAEGLLYRRLGPGDRQALVEDRSRRRDLDVGHADHYPPRRWQRRDRHQRHEDPRLRRRDRQAAVDARAELGDYDWHAGGGQRPGLRDRRLSAGAADLRHPARRQR